MPVQRIAAVALLAAGVLMLAGPGWAALTLGALLWVRDERVESWAAKRWADVRERARQARDAVAAVPRPATAGLSMAAGLVVAPVGVLVLAGVGAGLVAAGVGLVGFSLITGWNA